MGIKEDKKKWRDKNPNYAKEYAKRWRKENPELYKQDMEKRNKRSAAYKKIHYARNKDNVRNRQLLRDYGISIVEYNSMFLKQKGLCLICFKPEIIESNEGVRRLCVDHCHTSGKVRGLLCTNCNQGIGKFKDNTQTLRNAIQYLEDSTRVF